jgi:predicted ferric reductase
MCLAAGLAFLPFRARFYEPFLLLHIAFVILTLVGCWYHLVPHFTLVYGYQVWLYICFAFWGAEWFARLSRVAFYNGITGSKAVVETIPGCDGILQITVFPRTVVGFGPAQHSFLHFSGLQGRFWESHPFSVAGWTTPGQPPLPVVRASAESVQAFDSDAKETNTPQAHAVFPTQRADTTRASGLASIRFLTRVHSGITSTLRDRVLSSPSGESLLETSVYTQGPYAGHRATLHPLYTADSVLCLAGGIGITHMLALVQQYVRGRTAAMGHEEHQGGKSRKTMAARRFVLAWSAREAALIEHVRQNFLVGVEGVELLFWCTGSFPGNTAAADKEELVGAGQQDVKLGRMNIESVLRAAAEPGQQTAVLVCAPGGMADEITRQVVRCVGDGLQMELVEEAFAW